MAFQVFKIEMFDKDFGKLDNSEQVRVEKILTQIMERGDEVGKPLSGVSSFREMKFGGKRVYFIVYKELSAVLVIAISDKKTQQATINHILADFSVYHSRILENLKKNQSA